MKVITDSGFSDPADVLTLFRRDYEVAPDPLDPTNLVLAEKSDPTRLIQGLEGYVGLGDFLRSDFAKTATGKRFLAVKSSVAAGSGFQGGEALSPGNSDDKAVRDRWKELVSR